jgi:hypothetical protein
MSEALHRVPQAPQIEMNKWLRIQVLLDTEEMAQLFSEFSDLQIYYSGSLVPCGKEKLENELFLQAHKAYIDALKTGNIPNPELYRREFSTVWTAESSALLAVDIAEERSIVRQIKPVIQVQHHTFDYSLLDGKFRSMVHGSETIFWGIQLSYPQIYQDIETEDVIVLNDGTVPNTSLFRGIQRWLRRESIPTPFSVKGEKQNVSFRIGKKCLPWIQSHPQLHTKNLVVETEKSRETS